MARAGTSQQLFGRGHTAAIRALPCSLSRLVSRSSTTLVPNIVCSVTPRPTVNVASIHALDPDFYKIPYVDGVPVGKRLKLWNLPPNCKHSELLEWFAGADVVVESLELTDDSVLNAQGIGGFVEFATKQHACIAIVRLDGYKFRGHYIRMDFSERRPRPYYGSKRSRTTQNSSRRESITKSSYWTAGEMPPNNSGRSSSSQLIARYDNTITRADEASSDFNGMSLVDNTLPSE